MGAIKDYTGKKLGKIMVTGRAANSDGGATRWFVDCDCGQDGVVLSARNIGGGQHHCGCEFTEKSKKISEARKRHMERQGRPPIITAPQRVVNDYLYKYRVPDEARQ